MNRQVHSTIEKSPYGVVFKQLMPNRPRIFPAERSTVGFGEDAASHEEIEQSIEPSIDPQLQATGSSSADTQL